MDRQQILEELRRITSEAEGTVPGRRRFEELTGIRESDWSGKYWARWSDAVREAGLAPNDRQGAYSDEHLLSSLARITRELGRFPVAAELRMWKRRDASLPSHGAFDRFGSTDQLAERLRNWCVERGEEEIAEMCARRLPRAVTTTPDDSESSAVVKPGYVYLARHGSRREYKIGRTHNPIRREGELRIELPEQLTPVHTIETDYPAGIERYWHERFADKRMNGEWFALDTDDVRAFKRWRRIH